MSDKIKEQVTCQICGFTSNYLISSGHLKKHNISVIEYRKRFPDAKMVTDTHHERLHTNQMNIAAAKKEDNDIIVEYEPTIMKSPISVKSTLEDELNLFSKIDELKKDFKSPSNYFSDPNNLIPADKHHILNYLVNLFPKYKIENNFYVEKAFLNGVLDYRFITDIAIPELMLDIEFINAFWHNYDRPKDIRDFILKQDGWTIIDINERIPNLDTINVELKSFMKKKKIK